MKHVRCKISTLFFWTGQVQIGKLFTKLENLFFNSGNDLYSCTGECIMALLKYIRTKNKLRIDSCKTVCKQKCLLVYIRIGYTPRK